MIDAIRARRSRLVAKRFAVFVAGVVSLVAAGLFSLAPQLTVQVLGVMVSMGGALVGATGCVLLFIESTAVDARGVELRRYVERRPAGAEAAARLRAAGERGRS